MSESKDIQAVTDDGYVHDQIKEHEFDGIQEFDNKLPNWWLWTLYGSIVFSLLYWIVFHTLGIGTLPRARFAHEMQAAQEAQLARAQASGLSNQTFMLMTGMAPKVAEGKAVFTQYCVQCHLEDGRGLVGPNLTDGYWLHGCEPMQIYKTVSDGVAAKGMPAWMNQLGPTRVQAVVSYVLTIRNTDVKGKEPQGDPCNYVPPAGGGEQEAAAAPTEGAEQAGAAQPAADEGKADEGKAGEGK